MIFKSRPTTYGQTGTSLIVLLLFFILSLASEKQKPETGGRTVERRESLSTLHNYGDFSNPTPLTRIGLAAT